MNKRILASFLALVLAFSMLPSAVIAEGEEHIHCLCGVNTEKGTVCEECGGKAVVWTAWEATNALPEGDGYFYLTEDVTAEKAEYRSVNTVICLHGKDIVSATGERHIDIYKNGILSITDCAETAGQICGANRTGGGSVAWIWAGGELNLYGGHITDNTTSSDGTIYVDKSDDASVPGGVLNMYGGELSGNTARRGAGVYMASNGVNVPSIRILGGTITENTGTGTGSTGGGAGVLSFRPLEIGGDAKIYSNTAASGASDILLRNDGTFTGTIVLSDEHPVKKGANIHYSLKIVESDPTDLQFITGTPEKWKNIWLSYDGQKVGYSSNKFFVDDGPADTEDEDDGGDELVTEHYHCLCGSETTQGNICTFCGSKVVGWAAWEATDALPEEDGFFYLTDEVTTEKAEYRGINTAICLHGKDIVSATGDRHIDVYKNGTLSITDCADTVGQIRGSNKVTSGSALRVWADGVLNLYGGHITGNTASGDGTIYVDKSDDASVPGGVLNMYGGEISGNTARRGAGIYSVSGGTNGPVVRILGGTITDNIGTGTGSTGGGAGVVSFHPLEIGGNAKVYGNTAATAPNDILIRNDDTFSGAIVVSVTCPVMDGAQINYSLKTAETNIKNLQFISGVPENWDSNWVSYDGQKVGYKDGKFFIDTGIVLPDHIHCLCGKETTKGNTCASCGGKAVMWEAWEENGALPEIEGYYYLNEDVTAETAEYRNVNTAICLHGKDIISKSGNRLINVFNKGNLSITNCVDTVGQIRGVNGTSALRVWAGGELNFYGGQITGNTTSGDGTVYVDKSDDASVPGGVFNMYGGEICDNIARRGAGVYTASGGTNGPVVRILGGTITDNTGTGTGSTGGGAGVVSFRPLTVGGDAKIYGNTAATAPADILIRNDGTFTGAIVLSEKYPLKDGAKLSYSLKEPEIDQENLQSISGKPTVWDNSWVACDGAAVKYKDGKFYTAADIVISGHDHDGHSWISVTTETQLLPDKDGYYVLDGDVTLPKEIIILSGNHVILCLNGYTLTAAEGARHFDVRAGAKLTICDCTAKTENGQYTAGQITGGNRAIRVNAGAELYLHDGIICDNKSTGNGGALYLVAASKTEPGAVFHMYGGMICRNLGTYGGAIRFTAPADGLAGPTFRMEGGWICDNESPDYGGAIHAADGATIELLGGIIENNTAKSGAALSVNGASKVILTGTIIRNNTAVTHGGGMYLQKGVTFTMSGGRISGNSAKIGAGVLLTSEGTNMTMSGGKITGNKAGSAGGGGVYASSNTVFTMNGGEFSANETEAHGAGLTLYGATGNITGGIFKDNKAPKGAGMALLGSKVYLGEALITGNESSGFAGGVYVARAGTIGANVIIDGAEISNNKAKTTGGGMYVFMNGNTLTMKSGKISGNSAKNGGGVVVQRICTFTLEGGEISGNTATNIAGGFYASIDSTFIMNGGSITGNYAQKNGAGAYILAANFQLNGGTISYNTAKNTAGGVYVAGGKGGFNGTWITNNAAQEGSGGGVIIVSTSINVDGVITPVCSNVCINAGRIAGNTTPKAAAGLLIQSKGTVVNMYGGKVCENVATKFAGGIYVYNKAVFNMHGGEICYNVSEKDVGGGLYHYGGSGNHTGGEIYGNVSDTTGGGILVGGKDNTVTFKNMKIYENRAGVGAGVGQQTESSQLIMENCEIYNNEASQNGAAVLMYNGTAKLIACYIHDNEAKGNGAAVCTSALTNIILEDCTIEHNKAGGKGGALFSRGVGFTVKNCMIRNNEAADDGGAIATAQTGDTLSGHTIGLVIEDTLIEGNVSGGIGGGLYQSWGSKGTLKGVAFLNNISAAEGSALWAKDEFTMSDVTATGNHSQTNGYAVYLADVEYDGHSFFSGLTKMSGSMKIHDNQGGDMYLDKDATIVITEPGLAEDTRIEVTLSDNVLTNRIWGDYDYEGGNLIYTITYGNRSVIDPEKNGAPQEPVEDPTQGGAENVATPTEDEKIEPKDNTGMLAGIAAVVLVMAAAVIAIVVVAKKKSAK